MSIVERLLVPLLSSSLAYWAWSSSAAVLQAAQPFGEAMGFALRQ